MNHLSTFISASLRLPKIYHLTSLRRSKYYSIDAQQQSVKRKYPIGISDFKLIKEENFFFWDRTRFVKDFYEDPGQTILVLRPRRWAKSTTVSMVKYFFNKDVKNPELAKQLFAGTQIEEEKEFVSRTQGQFPVVSLSLGGCRAEKWEEMKVSLREVISYAYKQHKYLEGGDFLDNAERKELDKIREKDPTVDYRRALFTLTELLHRYHNKRAIVLIDEYDVPVNEAYIHGYLESALPFLTSTFTDTLKDNPYLEKGLLTGVLRVAKAGYLSGLNNLCVYSLLDMRYATMYGVQQQELKEALEYEGLTDKADDVKSYYNGYNTAIPSVLLYNPWSILKYLSYKKLEPYWTETGRIDFVANAMWSSPLLVRQTLLPLLNGETLVLPVETDIDFKALNSPNALWSLLYFSGYLTGESKDEENLEARIPNTEVNRELAKMWRRVIEAKGFGAEYLQLISALLSGDKPIVETHLRTLARELFSAYDVARTPEAWYHAFMLSLLYPLKNRGYTIKSNTEAGLGRPDIVLHAPVGKPDVIIELKTITDDEEKQKIKSDDDKNLCSCAKKGLEQIIMKDYRKICGAEKTVILWSIAIVRKFVAVCVKEQGVTKSIE